MPTEFPRARRLCAALIGAAAACVAAASFAAELPRGWRFEGRMLSWTSPAPLHIGGARYEFRSGARLLGYPIQKGDRLSLQLTTDEPPADLSVRAAGRRIDAPSAAGRVTAPPPLEPAIAAAAFDAAAHGRFRTQRLRYQRAGLEIPGYEAPIEMLAEVTAPVDDIGPIPLVLFLHGRHNTCYRDGPDGEASSDWPCPAGWRAVPSHTGYRYIADLLASQGYLVVSIAANGVNGQDGLFLDGGASARSELVRRHLAAWARWNIEGGDPWGGRFRGRVNLRRVVLVGHSRGGEGVERAVIDSDARDPWTIRGLVLIGPTAFGRQVAAGVHTTVILPFCDGDVSDLQGQQYVDIGRSLTDDRVLRTSVMAMGTNHNYYNTEWTPGLSKSPAWDDWFDPGDPQCGETRDQRLAPAEQQAVGLAYTAALVDLAVTGQKRSLPFLDGTRVKPSTIGRANTFVHAIGGGKELLYAAGSGVAVTAESLSARECRGYFLAGLFDIRSGCAPELTFELTPHWSPMSFVETAPPPRALEVEWSRAGGKLVIPVSPLAGDALDFRIAGDPGAGLVELGVRVRDIAGRWTAVGTRPLPVRAYQGPSPLGKIVAREARMSLQSTRIDLGKVTAIELSPRTPNGRFWLLDVSAWRNSLPVVSPIHLPRVSVADVIVEEGDAGTVTVRVPIRIEGEVKRRARLWVQINDFNSFENPSAGFPLVLEPGAKSATVPFTYTADDIYTPFQQPKQIVLLARRNAVTGDFDGAVVVEEDDPPPVLAADEKDVTAAEGGSLTWTFRLSEPLAGWAFWPIELVPAAAGVRELDTDDVPPAFLENYGIVPPAPAVPLSQLGIFFGIEFASGEQVKSISIPLAQDGVTEGDEGVALRLIAIDDPIVPYPIELTGTVPGG
jgi:hypothetical protein